jgi:predicted nucleic acid-binding protein
MTLFYADSSVLVKRHIIEQGSAWVEQQFADANNHVVTSLLSSAEVISALNRRVREGSLDALDYPTMRDDFLALCQRIYRLVPITNPLLSQTRALLERHPLHTYDALHLASALMSHRQIQAAGLPALTFLAADHRLLNAAHAEGLATDNPNNYL